MQFRQMRDLLRSSRYSTLYRLSDSGRYPSDAWEYVKVLSKDSPSTYIDNARVQMTTLSLDELLLPVVVGDPTARNSNVCSPYSHYVRYTLEELTKHPKGIPPWLFKEALSLIGVLLKRCKIDKVVYVNNWLFATNPHQSLTRGQIARLTDYLQRQYPQHAIVYRSLASDIDRPIYDALQENGYRLVKSRMVYVIDPTSPRFLERRNVKEDLALLQDRRYTVVDNRGISDSDIPRLTELFRSLYLDKHSYLNPQLNEKFFNLTVRRNILTYRALKQGDTVDAFICYYVNGKVLNGAFTGYDRSKPQSFGLYRRAIGIVISEAWKRNLLLHLSSGAGFFKVSRGALPVVEYDAVYDRHLPLLRQFAWRLIWIQGRFWWLYPVPGLPNEETSRIHFGRIRDTLRSRKSSQIP